ncbi:RNA-binding protein [Stappia sp. F7233]|uniref:RNA-binding protein n=1 Tax=Stappia albiluteola TaxID=2758565 RepID=A0A839A9N1_9HYPH|nr:RNA-binding protein [Stappia albiluteola]MBA5776091.1 RNA-binding protein [Stappia albiluteola]
MPRKNEPLERCCALTRDVRPVSELVRFVEAPDGGLVPDIKAKLPGRGVWVTATAVAVAQAERKRVFARSLKSAVRVEPGLAERVDGLLEQAALSALSLTRKAGQVVTGFAKVEAALRSGEAVGLVQASDGAEDGLGKLAALAGARFAGSGGCPIVRLFTSAQLDLALGRSNVIHAALLAGPASAGFLERAVRLARYRSVSDGVPVDDEGSADLEPRAV